MRSLQALRSALRPAYSSCDLLAGLGGLGHRLHASSLSTAAKEPETQLIRHLKAKIMMRGGPISLAEFMQEALTSPHGGFYMSRDVFGAGGDFVTSPEISQVFGELVGIWAVHTWMQMGQPERLLLVELGPGRGTLMADLLRGTAGFKAFTSALEVHLVEVSPALRRLQWEALQCSAPAGQPPAGAARGAAEEPAAGAEQAGASASGGEASQATDAAGAPALQGVSALGGGCRVVWHSVLDTVPGAPPKARRPRKGEPAVELAGSRGSGSSAAEASDGAAAVRPAPALYIAHEFFDALPVHQFVRDPSRGWLEKLVDVVQPDTQPGAEPVANSDGGQAASSGASSSGAAAAAAEAGPSSGAPAAADRRSRAAASSSSSSSSSSDSGHGREAGPSSSSSLTASETEHFRLVLSPSPTPAARLLAHRRFPPAAPGSPPGSLPGAPGGLIGIPQQQPAQAEGEEAGPGQLEVSAHGMALAEALALRVGWHGGAALVVDYGRDAPYTDSLNAIRGHKGVPVLEAPGSADLSAWVDFSSLRLAAQGSGADVVCHGPVSQGAFLMGLGMEARMQALLKKAGGPEEAQALFAGCQRLVGEGPSGMGTTYQVMAIAHTSLPQLAGLEQGP